MLFIKKMNEITLVVVLLVGGIAFAVGFLARKLLAQNQVHSAEARASRIIDESKIKAKEFLVDAKDKSVKILEEAKEEERKRQELINDQERRIDQKEERIEQRLKQVEKEKGNLKAKAIELKKIRQEVLDAKQRQIERLEKISNMKKEDAKKILLNLAEEKYQEELVRNFSKLEKEKKEELEERAKNIMTQAMQRYAGSHATEVTTSTISIPSDDVKGRIIGREGRNIKALERLTGVEIIVDDTPEAIVISGFDPMRREIARIALERLMEDGRIHPAKIEEAVAKAKETIGKKIKEAGEAAVYDVGVAGLDPKLVQLIGRLRFRTSYGQNVLLHSIEVAHLSGLIAAELELDGSLAKKAGLLHDIGKAVDHEIQGTHVEIGISILKKFNQPQAVIDAVKSHHEDYPFESAYAFIVAAADALSASRPGARKDTLENYLKRLEELEDVVMSFEGVEKCYAIQAGREVRVFVNPEKVNDLGAVKLAQKIAEQIEEQLNYPGEIKVNLLREMRSVEYAR